MPDYIVFRKSDNKEVLRYSAASTLPQESDYPLEDYDHLINVPGEPEPGPASNTVLSRLEYLRLFTQSERIAIRQAATVNAVVQDYVEMLQLADEVHLDHEDSVTGVNALEAAGLIAPGRAAEILRG